MWWGGRGQSFNIAPHKEEPELGVRRRNCRGGGWPEGVEGDEVEVLGGKNSIWRGRRRRRRVCVSYQLRMMRAWSALLGLKFEAHYPLTSPSLHCLWAPGQSSCRQTLITPERLSVGLWGGTGSFWPCGVRMPGGLTLHPFQLSRPKSEQGSRMPELRSRRLGGCLASGCLPGNHTLPVPLMFRAASRLHPTQPGSVCFPPAPTPAQRPCQNKPVPSCLAPGASAQGSLPLHLHLP